MKPLPQRIGVVDDDPEIRRLVSELLIGEGYHVTAAESGAELDSLLSRETLDLLVLDLMLPGEDGLSICRRLRARTALPILMLTARSDEIDSVIGLELGADDYVTKPFTPRVLVARIRALLRRTAETPAAVPGRRYAFDRFRIDLDARLLTDETAVPVPLTSSEFDLLTCFVLHPRRVLSRDRILDWTHGRRADPFDRTVDLSVSRLRKKLDAFAADERLIATVRNGGYLLTATVQPVV